LILWRSWLAILGGDEAAIYSILSISVSKSSFARFTKVRAKLLISLVVCCTGVLATSSSTGGEIGSV